MELNLLLLSADRAQTRSGFVFGLLEFGLGDTIMDNPRTHSDVSGMVPDLQASYRNTAIELPIDR